jgi:hypothetical protein
MAHFGFLGPPRQPPAYWLEFANSVAKPAGRTGPFATAFGVSMTTAYLRER